MNGIHWFTSGQDDEGNQVLHWHDKMGYKWVIDCPLSGSPNIEIDKENNKFIIRGDLIVKSIKED